MEHVEAKGALHQHRPGEAPLAAGVVRARSITAKRRNRPRDGERVASARVTVGTQLFAARYLGAWATVKSAGPFTVRWLPKDDWVSIVGVPGIVSAGECPENSTVLDEAWAPRSSVQLPASKEPAKESNPDGGI